MTSQNETQKSSHGESGFIQPLAESRTTHTASSCPSTQHSNATQSSSAIGHVAQISTPTSSPPRQPNLVATTTGDACIETVTNLPNSRKRKLTSQVWNHMVKIKKDGKNWAICNYCKAHLKAISSLGTKSLHNHLSTCQKKNNVDIEVALNRQKQIAIEKKNDGRVQFGNFTFDSEVSRRELGYAIIMHEYPLSIVDHIGFKRFITSLQPFFKTVSRNTIKSDIMKIYDNEKEKLQNILHQNGGRVAITTDMWTSNQKKGYMSITAHYIDDNWVLQNRILRFIYVPTPHNKDVLAENLMEGLMSWNLETKLSTITVDNCRSSDGMLDIIVNKFFNHCLLDGRVLHMRCCARIINLVVQDGLDVIGGAIEKIRNSVVYWSATPSRVKKFEDIARQVKVNSTRKLILDCKTRWNSTYLMLQTAIEYKDVFPRMTLMENLYSCEPSEEDWNLAKQICEKLKLFYNTIEIFSGIKYPTSNSYFVKICKIRNALCSWKVSSNKVISEMASQMFMKFDKYWSDVHIVMAVGVILDPRYKLKVVEFYFPSIYGDYATIEIDKVKKTCYDLVQEYQSKYHKNCTSFVPSGSTSSVKFSDCEEEDDLLVEFLNNSSSSLHVKSELDHYLEEPVLPWTQEFDIFNWWKTNGIKYHTLQSMARDFLAIPVSTVTSESSFSTSGRVVSPHRSRLHTTTLEALMCSENWLRNDLTGSCSSTDLMCTSTIEDDVD